MVSLLFPDRTGRRRSSGTATWRIRFRWPAAMGRVLLDSLFSSCATPGLSSGSTLTGSLGRRSGQMIRGELLLSS